MLSALAKCDCKSEIALSVIAQMKTPMLLMWQAIDEAAAAAHDK